MSNLLLIPGASQPLLRQDGRISIMMRMLFLVVLIGAGASSSRLYADSQHANATMRVTVTVAPMITFRADPQPPAGDLQIPAASEVRVVIVRSTDSATAVRQDPHTPETSDSAASIEEEVRTTVIVPK